MSLIGTLQLLEFENETLQQRVKALKEDAEQLKAKIEQLKSELAAYKQPNSEKPLLTDSTP